jgi:hypothetical protein
VPGEVITKENLRHLAKELIEVEKIHLVSMASTYADTLHAMNIKVMSGEELYEKRYEKT